MIRGFESLRVLSFFFLKIFNYVSSLTPMPKKTLSSLELAALVSELHFLIHSKLTHIYQLNEEEFLFQFHVPGRGKQLLRVLSGKFICLIETKEETPLKPSGF